MWVGAMSDTDKDKHDGAQDGARQDGAQNASQGASAKEKKDIDKMSPAHDTHERGTATPRMGRDAPIEEIVPVAIGRRLRKLYDDIVSEPVPDRFTKLLEQLEQSESKPK